jgi:hypothetical protein
MAKSPVNRDERNNTLPPITLIIKVKRNDYEGSENYLSGFGRGNNQDET